MLKSIHRLASKEEREREFRHEFRLKAIAYEFNVLRNKLD